MSVPAASESPRRRRIIQPVPLTSQQEGEIQKIYTKNVRENCLDEIKVFAQCAKDHMVSVNFTCSDQKLAMNSCLRKYGTMAEHDKAREEWFANRVTRKKKEAEDEETHVRKVLADRARLDEYEARMKANEPKKTSWWSLGGLWSAESTKSEVRSPDTDSKGNG